VLVAREVLVVQDFIAIAHQIDIYSLVLAKPVQELLDGHRTLLQHSLIVVSVAFGNTSHWAEHNGVHFPRLVLLDIIGLGNHEIGKGQVDKGVLELLDVGEALSVLVDLIGDNTSDHGCGGGNGRDDLASNHLHLVALAFSNLVIAGSQVRASCDEVDVEVLVVIFLKVSSDQGTRSVGLR